MFKKITKSNKAMLDEVLDRANKLSQDFQNINAEIVKAGQFDMASELGKFGKEEYGKFVNEVSAEHPFDKSEVVQQRLQEQYFEKMEDIRYRMITHARDLSFANFMSLHQKIYDCLELAQYKLIELMELKTAARDRSVIARRGNFVKNVGVLADTDIIETFKQLRDSMVALKSSAESISHSLYFAFLFLPESTHEDQEIRNMAIKGITRIRASNHENTDQYQIFKAFAESMPSVELMKSFSEYLASHAKERLLSIDLLKQVNPLCDEIIANHKESINFVTSAIEVVEEARREDVKRFMEKQIVSKPYRVTEIFAKNGLVGMLSDKESVHKLMKLAIKDKNIRIAIASEINRGVQDKNPSLLIDIMSDNSLARDFRKLTMNRSIRNFVENYDEIISAIPTRLIK